MDYLVFLIRISICFVLGGIIGLERQCRGKAVGIRTITLVSLGSFLFVSISTLSPANDVTRIAAQVVSGIGFLGAGVILRDGTNIRGLNTAATLWCGAAIGSLTAMGLIFEALVGVLYILLANLFLRFISRKLLKQTIHTKIINYELTIRCKDENEDLIRNTIIHKLQSHQIAIKTFLTENVNNKIKLILQIGVKKEFSDDLEMIVNKLCLDPKIISIGYNEVSSYVEDDDDDYDDDK